MAPILIEGKTVDGWWFGTSSHPDVEDQQKYVFLPMAGGISLYAHSAYRNSDYNESSAKFGMLGVLDPSTGSSWDILVGLEMTCSGNEDTTKAPIRCVCDRP